MQYEFFIATHLPFHSVFDTKLKKYFYLYELINYLLLQLFYLSIVFDTKFKKH